MQNNYFEKLGYVDLVPLEVVGAAIKMIVKDHRAYRGEWVGDYKVTSIGFDSKMNLRISVTAGDETKERIVAFSMIDDHAFTIKGYKNGSERLYISTDIAAFICHTVTKIVETSLITGPVKMDPYFEDASSVDNIIVVAMLATADSPCVLRYSESNHTVDKSTSKKDRYVYTDIKTNEIDYVFELNTKVLNIHGSNDTFPLHVIADLYHATKIYRLYEKTV